MILNSDEMRCKTDEPYPCVDVAHNVWVSDKGAALEIKSSQRKIDLLGIDTEGVKGKREK